MAHTREKQIRVLIADVEPLFLEGLARSIRLDAGMRLVGDIADATAALAAIRRLRPDVAVLDERLDGLRILSAVAQHGVGTRVALLAAAIRPDDAFEAVAAGARGYLSKRVKGEVVRDAIRRIAAGESVLCAEAQTSVTSEIRLRQQSEHALLTAREFDVLVLLADGMTYAEIGLRLHLAPSTVKSYTANVCERLGARDRLGAVVEAMRRGILR